MYKSIQYIQSVNHLQPQYIHWIMLAERPWHKHHSKLMSDSFWLLYKRWWWSSSCRSMTQNGKFRKWKVIFRRIFEFFSVYPKIRNFKYRAELSPLLVGTAQFVGWSFVNVICNSNFWWIFSIWTMLPAAAGTIKSSQLPKVLCCCVCACACTQFILRLVDVFTRLSIYSHCIISASACTLVHAHQMMVCAC